MPTWIGYYKYDSVGYLIEINERYEDIYKTMKYEYNDKGLLVTESIESNGYPLTPETAFSTTNNRVEYRYDSLGHKSAKLVYNHKDELRHTCIYRKIYKTP